jgi:hypothetical protein
MDFSRDGLLSRAQHAAYAACLVDYVARVVPREILLFRCLAAVDARSADHVMSRRHARRIVLLKSPKVGTPSSVPQSPQRQTGTCAKMLALTNHYTATKAKHPRYVPPPPRAAPPRAPDLRRRVSVCCDTSRRPRTSAHPGPRQATTGYAGGHGAGHGREATEPGTAGGHRPPGSSPGPRPHGCDNHGHLTPWL